MSDPVGPDPDGDQPPLLRVRPPGPESRSWLTRAARVGAPMGPARRPARAPGEPAGAGTIVYRSGQGSNVTCADGNRYVDLCGGFGSLLLGHGHPAVARALAHQAAELAQAMGDVHPSLPRIALLERLSELVPGGAQGILGQSGADAITAALGTALLHTGRPGVLAFEGAYHGLSWAPLAACGLRASYRLPFAAQLNPHVTFLEPPTDDDAASRALEAAARALATGAVGAVLVEPVLGRGGCIVPPPGFLGELGQRARSAGALVIADEIWTALGRTGSWLASVEQGLTADLITLGKGLGGGLPVSACLGRPELMAAWRRDDEVVMTSTFAGAPLACATALATLSELSRRKLPERAAALGEAWRAALQRAVGAHAAVRGVRGRGLMIGIELAGGPGSAGDLARRLLERGWITSTGGRERDVLVLTPPLTVGEGLLPLFDAALVECLGAAA